jgi:hypothetical protein
MYQKFHIGQQTDTYAHTLDVSKFPSIEQLRATLAEVFGFADAKSAHCPPFSGDHCRLG